jgi:hypothetical protein
LPIWLTIATRSNAARSGNIAANSGPSHRRSLPLGYAAEKFGDSVLGTFTLFPLDDHPMVLGSPVSATHGDLDLPLIGSALLGRPW